MKWTKWILLQLSKIEWFKDYQLASARIRTVLISTTIHLPSSHRSSISSLTETELRWIFRGSLTWCIRKIVCFLQMLKSITSKIHQIIKNKETFTILIQIRTSVGFRQLKWCIRIFQIFIVKRQHPQIINN